ncbi:nucleotidyltransferase family protein [Bacteroidales bacterium OttesenSCG-928-M06]|nr:nucleotidyltransferase family protein [Bacteroidales bacterium OttesenSCG-928-M06]
MEVIILAGGKGTRLQSVVSDVPKCMAEVAGKPFLHYLFQQLIPFCPDHIVLSLGYKHTIVEEWIKTQKLPFKVTCKVEHEPLGTGGAIKYAFSAVDSDSAVVINGDTFFDVNLNEFYSWYKLQKPDVAIVLKEMDEFDRYGSVDFNQESYSIINFNEKQYKEHGFINGGIYALKKESLSSFPVKFSLENDYFPLKVKENSIIGFVSEGMFIDIGIPSDYKKAQTVFSEL